MKPDGMYRHEPWHTSELLRQQEGLSWQLACLPEESESDSQYESSCAFLLSHLAEVTAEIDRRARWKHSPGAPPWPGKECDLRPFWASIKARVSVLDFYEAASLGILRKSGNGYRSRCPLCHSTNESTFSIFDDCRAWHCFRCGEGGDVFTLASHIWCDLNFPEVAFSLADLFGIERPAKNGSFLPDSLYKQAGRKHFRESKPARVAYVGGKVVSRA